MACLVFSVGCVTLPERFARQAAKLGLQRGVVTGTRFQHVVYRKSGTPAHTLHVYLDGDGTPWIAGRPADDPTPRNPLVLRLLALDPAPAVYLGRPCYHGAGASEPCASRYWLSERYSEAVVDSLAMAIRKMLMEENHERVAWFGYSGGGTLATLLAARFPETSAIVTIAANLDTESWAAYAGGQDLSGSLNPAAHPPLPRRITQRHYAGGKDQVVPSNLTAQAATRQGSALILVAGYDHVCCWERAWPTILRNLPNETPPASGTSYQGSAHETEKGIEPELSVTR